VRIQRIGCTPLKGGRHLAHATLPFDASGPVGDRVFCAVDPARGSVLRTVENPSLLQVVARWDGTTLTMSAGGRGVHGRPEVTGTRLSADYWGRPAALEVVQGPWARWLSAHLERDVVLAQVVRPGEVVYGAAVSIVTTSSLAWLATTVGATVDPARFRATLVVDTGDAAAPLEQGWRGAPLQVGAAQLQVRDGVRRCGVIDFDPATGNRDSRLLKAVAHLQDGDDTVLGVDAVVTGPGLVRVGDPVRVS